MHVRAKGWCPSKAIVLKAVVILKVAEVVESLEEKLKVASKGQFKYQSSC